MNIITLTLNPSLDRTVVVHNLALGYLNYAQDESTLHAAGSGLNVSHALQLLGAKTEALLLLGDGPISQAYGRLLENVAFPYHVVRYPGTIRSNLFIKDTFNQTETRIKNHGDSVSEAILQEVLELLESRLQADDYVVLAGDLPFEADPATYARFIETTRAAGAKAVLSTYNQYLEPSLAAKPTLTILTQQQAEGHFNFPVRVLEDVIYCAHKLQEQGSERVLIVLNEDHGAVLLTEDELWVAEFGEEQRGGTHSGVSDALLAGYLQGRLQDWGFARSLAAGVAAAQYTASQMGSEFGELSDLKPLMEQVDISNFESD